MNIPPIVPDANPPAQSAKPRPVSQDQFLQLLVTQLQHQDPLNPADNQTMMAQLAQFSMLDQMKAVALSSHEQSAFTLLGHKVTATGASGEQLSGAVTAVRRKDGQVHLVLDSGSTIDVNDVTEVVR